MKKLLFLCDIDGCVAPMPFRKTVAPGTNPTELDWAFGNIKWEIEELTADPATHFPVDQDHVVEFKNDYQKPRDVRVMLSTEMLERLKAIAADPKVDFRWLTMWNENSQGKFTDLVGFSAPYLRTNDYSSEMYDHFKSWAVADLFERDKADFDTVIWLDDVHNKRHVTWPELDEEGYERYIDPMFKKFGVDALVIRTNKHWGISREEMAKVESFIDDYAG